MAAISSSYWRTQFYTFTDWCTVKYQQIYKTSFLWSIFISYLFLSSPPITSDHPWSPSQIKYYVQTQFYCFLFSLQEFRLETDPCHQSRTNQSVIAFWQWRRSFWSHAHVHVDVWVQQSSNQLSAVRLNLRNGDCGSSWAADRWIHGDWEDVFLFFCNIFYRL